MVRHQLLGMGNITRSYRDLTVWQKAVDLTVGIYIVTETFPAREIYALSSQMRRAAISIPSNIAEGRSRKTRKDFVHFLHIALGSATELETQLLIAERLSFVQKEQSEKMAASVSEVCRMLHGMLKKLEASS